MKPIRFLDHKAYSWQRVACAVSRVTGGVGRLRRLLITALAVCACATAVAAPTFQAAGGAVGGTGSVSPAWPAHAVNDIALLFIESTGGEAATLSPASGFVAVANSPRSTGTGTAGTRITVFWARATSTTMAAPTILGPGNHVYARILTYRGVITTGDPWDVTGGGVKASGSRSVTVSGVTTTVPDTLIVQVVARQNDRSDAEFSAQTNSNLASIGERADGGTTSGNGGGFAVWDGVKLTAGATGNTTASLSRSSVNAFLTMALKPAPTLHHIRIEHDGVASNCAPEPITLKACADVTCAVPHYIATDVTGINLSPTSAGYTWTPGSTVSITAASGGINAGSITLVRASNGTATLAITGTSIPAPVSAYECYNTATATSGDCNLVYSGNFSFNVLDHTSATRQVVALTSCTSSFANQTRSVKFWSTYVNPNSGTLQGAVVAGSGNVDCATGYAALGTSLAAATTLNLAFGAGVAPQATFSLCYPDAGQVRVDTRYGGSAATGDAGVVILGNDSFIAKPDHFSVSNVKRTSDNSANPGAMDASGAAFIKAGDSTTAVARFTATVTAKNAKDAATPNFGVENTPEGLVVTSVLVAPVAGDAGVLTCKNSPSNCVVPGGAANFSGGTTTITDLAWDEVGIIQLMPKLADGDYLGTGVLTTPTASGNIGRFHPDHLAVVPGSATLQARADIAAPLSCVTTAQSDAGDITSGANQLSITDVTPFTVGDSVVVVGAGGADLYTVVTAIDTVNDILTLSASASTTVTDASVFQRANFTYLGEPIRLSFQAQALNALNAVTQNYNSSGGYAKLTAGNVSGFGANDSWGLWAAANQLYGVGGCRALFSSVAPYSTTYSPAGCVTLPAAGYGAPAARVGTTGTPTASWVAGVGALDAQVVVNRANVPDGPFNWVGLGVLPQDADGVLTTNKDFDADSIAGADRVRVGAAEFNFGRLKLSNATGSELLDLPIPLVVQYWSSAGFVTNANDSCTTITAANIKLGTYNPVGFSANVPPANVSISGTLVSGRGNLTLLKPSPVAKGSLQLCVDLDAGAGGDASCQATTPANMAYLQGAWLSGSGYVKDPSARVGFGLYKGADQFIYLRENY